MSARFIRVAGLAIVTCMAMLTAGCAGDDDGGGGGGGGKIAPPPTARPSFTGMSTVLNASGGSSNSGNNNGALGGIIQIIAFQGRIIEGSASSPSINSNFLAPALSLGNTITYTQLSNLDPTKFSVSAGIARVDLFGQDFYLPTGATLDLSDAPSPAIASLLIFTHGTGDFIRLDGTVVSARAGASAVGLQLTSGTNAGTAISVNGTIDLRGAAGQDSATFRSQALAGSVSVGGTIDVSSVDSAIPGGAGSTALLSNQGNVHVAHGQFVTNGGAGSGTGSGADGGFVAMAALSSDGAGRPRWGVRANGGNATGGDGGAGGLAQVIFSELLDVFMPFEFNGGASTSATGGNGGIALLLSSVLKGAATVSAVGGASSNAATFLGGVGGRVELTGSTWMRSFALDANVSGGSGHTGGEGGVVSAPTATPVPTEMGIVDQVLIDVTANGGTGVLTGGQGGEVSFTISDSARNLTVDAELHGGAATGATGVGGAAGTATMGLRQNGHNDDNIRVQVVANGGAATAGLTGGAGGTVMVVIGLAATIGDIHVDIAGSLDGGDSAGTGGNGGLVMSPGAGITAIDIGLDLTAHGGAGGTGSGGNGGTLQLGNFVVGNAYLELTGLFAARGGAAQDAAMTGGTGGTVTLATPPLTGIATLDDFHAELSGGDNTLGDGGQGGTVTATFNGTTSIRDSSFITSGGQGSTVSGTGVGGEAGSQTFGTQDFDMNITGSTFRANGGNGRAGGGAGASGALTGILFTTTLNNASPAAALFINAIVEASGGAALVSGDGGDAGSIGVDQNENATLASFAAVTELRGTWLALGGAGITNGGAGGIITGTSTGDNMTVNATMSANGGTGSVGGDGGFVALFASDSTATGTIVYDLAGTLSADGGTGTTQGGQGGQVLFGGDDLAVTVRAIINATGGAGPVGGDGGDIQCVGFVASTPTSITVTSTARLRANGGNANGDGGLINMDAQGTGGLANPNYIEQAGSVLEANPHGTGTAGTITRD